MMARGPERPGLLVGLATQGVRSADEDRLRALCQSFDTDVVAFQRGSAAQRLSNLPSLIRRFMTRDHDLTVMEGTGLAGGLALIAARIVGGRQYVVSTGDAVGPFVAAQRLWAAPAFALYERLLYRLSAGVIGWTPYIAGRALTFGAPRVCTVEGWAPPMPSGQAMAAGRLAVRRRLGIPRDALVVGIVGSLTWSRRRRYCYGLELVEASVRTRRTDAHFVVVGDGDGRQRLESLAARHHAHTIHVVGRVPRTEIPDYLAAFDIGSLPQSRDRVGSFRYSTKLAEYLAAGVPVITGRLPLAYDLDSGWLWRIPGRAPWDPAYWAGLAALVDELTPGDIARKGAAALLASAGFDAARSMERAACFLREVVAEVTARASSPAAANEATDR